MSEYILISGAYSDMALDFLTLSSEMHSESKFLILGRNLDRLNEVTRKFPQMEVKSVQIDVTDESQVLDFVNNLIAEEVRVSSFISFVGEHIVKPIKITKKADYLDLYISNVISATNIISKLRRIIIPGGSIVLVGSSAISRGSNLVSAYVAAKSALVGYTKSAALEFADIGVRVNCVHPGVVKTRASEVFLQKVGDKARSEICSRHPLGLGEVRDMSYLVEFLACGHSRWLTGQSIYLDGGFSISN
jgi:NAD(P)-dependent dehydrogenase (short-subunit alcohol dehydrogenase family)